MQTSRSRDIAPPGDDLAEVMKGAVPPGQQVLDHLFFKAWPPDALVELRHSAVGGPGRFFRDRMTIRRVVVLRG